MIYVGDNVEKLNYFFIISLFLIFNEFKCKLIGLIEYDLSIFWI